ncbi:unnamed protein product [Prorocentrum cordatum]|uniref:Protochlorophyllide reductase n=1 Tax=Prorocentrum cordatum TaxID=2364126 RepID=A0ABN9VHT7_9DINO|nr:unnamed protein product [Polarella glacialis]
MLEAREGTWWSVPLQWSPFGLFCKTRLIDGGMDVFSPPAGSLRGRTVVITGGNTGLGFESAVRLARAGATVVITARTAEKGVKAVEQIKLASGSSDVHQVQLDLADLANIKSFPGRYEALPVGTKIDVLMNNAGVMAIPQRQETKNGFEQQFGINHLGHFALVSSVLPLLKKSEYARVINVSSTASLPATRELMEGDIMAPENYTQWGAYVQSKFANVIFAKELDRRFKAAGVNATAVSLHPGAVDTDLGRWMVGNSDDPRITKSIQESNPVLKALTSVTRPVDLGANTQVYLAAGADGGYDKSGGLYFDNMAPAEGNSLANDEALAQKIWLDSERLTGVKIDL